MAIFRHTSDLPPAARGAVIAIGNFDGVHRGHQAVIAEIKRIAAELDRPAAVLTFEPHPRRFFRPDDPPFQLTSFRLKARLLETLGVDHVVFLTFNLALSRLSAADFVRDILVRDLAAAHVVVGDNFHFGHKRQGNVDFLRAAGAEHGFGVTVLSRILGQTGEAYSSTAIREYLKAGDPTRAALFLGRYWEMEGRVLEGARLGRTLGFPTANIAMGEGLEPAHGVYAVRAGVDHGDATAWHAGVASLGTRPTVDGKTVLLEVHLFDIDLDLYGQHMRVALVDYLRPEWTFDTLEALRAQMVEDASRARVILARERWEAGWPASPFVPGPEGKGHGGDA
jgi:riboflavin kinase/FMN adenylyltransferase